MNTQHLTRQLDIVPEEKLRTRITIIGAGAIGSFTALSLAKMGFKDITVYDDDTVDAENMNSQFYPLHMIGRSKVQALREVVEMFTGTQIKPKEERIDDTSLIRGNIAISAVDSMKARDTISKQCASTWLIDGRMGAEYISLHSVYLPDTEQVDNYKRSLYSDEEAIQERCTAKSTMYTVNLIAGLIGKTVKDIVTDQKPITTLDWSVIENSAVWFSGNKKLTM